MPRLTAGNVPLRIVYQPVVVDNIDRRKWVKCAIRTAKGNPPILRQSLAPAILANCVAFNAREMTELYPDEFGPTDKTDDRNYTVAEEERRAWGPDPVASLFARVFRLPEDRGLPPPRLQCIAARICCTHGTMMRRQGWCGLCRPSRVDFGDRPSFTAAPAPSESRFQGEDGAFRCARVARRTRCGLCRPYRGLCRPGATERSISYRTYPVDSAGQASSKTANSLQLALGRQGPHRQSGLSTAGLTGEESQERGYGRDTRPSGCARTAGSAWHGRGEARPPNRGSCGGVEC